MKLHEYQLKTYFKKNGIPVPVGHVTSIAREAKLYAEEIDAPVVVKAQVLAEGRGAEGGIILAKTPAEAQEAASAMLSSEIKGLPVSRVLIDEAVSIEKEYYVLITFDRTTRKPVMMMYDKASLYVETAAIALSDSLEKIEIDPLIGLQRFQIVDLAYRLDFPQNYLSQLIEICQAMYRLFCDMDALLVAINPLAITKDGRLLAIDGKVTVDDNAFYRQELLYDFQVTGGMPPGPVCDARKYGMYYFKLDGNIGCMMNGGGLAMACQDYISMRGGRPANYLNMSGNVYEEKVHAALNLLFDDPDVKVILAEIFGGRTDCLTIAKAMLETIDRNERNLPIIVRFIGDRAKEAADFLKDSPVITAASFPEAVDKVLELIGEST